MLNTQKRGTFFQEERECGICSIVVSIKRTFNTPGCCFLILQSNTVVLKGHFYFYFREQQRRKLDQEILHLEFSAQGLEGTWADKRRAAARARNQRILHVSFQFSVYFAHHINHSFFLCYSILTFTARFH